MLGVSGLLLGDTMPVAGILNIDLPADLANLLGGALLTFSGFGRVAAKRTKRIVGVTGTVYLLCGIVGLVYPSFFGILAHNYSVGDAIMNLLLGVIGIGIGFLLNGGGAGNP